MAPRTRRQTELTGIKPINPIKSFDCQICSRGFYVEKKLASHYEQRHTEQKPVNGQCSGRWLFEEKDMGPHYENKIKPPAKLTRRQTGLTGIQPMNSIKSFDCQICVRGFYQEKKLVSHYEQRHPEQKPVDYQVCGRRLFEKKVIMESSYENKNKNLQKPRNHWGILTANKKRAKPKSNNQKKRRRVVEPLQIFTKEEEPQAHAKSTCKEPGCGKVFPTRISLYWHFSTHKFMKLYQCKMCNDMIIPKRNLLRHLWVVHTKDEVL